MDEEPECFLTVFFGCFEVFLGVFADLYAYGVLRHIRCIALFGFIVSVFVCTPSIKNGVGVLNVVTKIMLSFFARGGVNSG